MHVASLDLPGHLAQAGFGKDRICLSSTLPLIEFPPSGIDESREGVGETAICLLRYVHTSASQCPRLCYAHLRVRVHSTPPLTVLLCLVAITIGLQWPNCHFMAPLRALLHEGLQ